MAVINHDTREVTFKLVYCGTPMGGKTTNLTYIHSRIDAGQRGDLVSLATVSDRTLFFDLLPVDTAVINGYRTRFMLYTVPGQVAYNASRQMVLRGVDGVIFVADSQLDRMEDNLSAWHTMKRNLSDLSLSLEDLPAVLQYNKRDVEGAAPVPYMEYLFNQGSRRLPSVESAASSGYNVFATLNSLSQEVLTRFHRVTSAPGPPASPVRA